VTRASVRAATVAAALLLLIGGAAVYGSVQLGIGTLTVPEPGFFPLLAALALTALSAALLVGDFRRRPTESQVPSPMRPVLTAIIGLALYVAALGWLGYLLATVLLVSVLLAVFGIRQISAYALAVPLIAGGSYLLFHVLLSLPLPVGVFGI